MQWLSSSFASTWYSDFFCDLFCDALENIFVYAYIYIYIYIKLCSIKITMYTCIYYVFFRTYIPYKCICNNIIFKFFYHFYEIVHFKYILVLCLKQKYTCRILTKYIYKNFIRNYAIKYFI